MFGIIGGSEARRLPGASQFPWKKLGLVLLTVTLITVIVLAFLRVQDFISRFTTPDAPTPAQVVEQLAAVQQPIAQPVQPAPVVSAPVAPVVVDYQVVWTEVRGFDPSTIPVEKGFYNGTFPTQGSWSPSNPKDIPEDDAFAWKILPYLREAGRGTIVAAVRAQDNRDVVLVSIGPATLYQHYVLLSVDGEKSWCMLNMLPLYQKGYQHGAVNDPRVVARGEEIHLYGQDARPGYHWWETVVKKSELPCS